ncbi:MAG: hypothetical protein RH859_11145 [Longimicrobiales bacterium]
MRRTALFVALAATVASGTLDAQTARRPFLFKDSRAELAQARARGEADVLLVMAAVPGRTADLARAVAAAGGTVQFRDDEVGYLRARVPLEGVEALTGNPALHSVDVSLTPGRPRTFALADGEGPVGPERPLERAPQAQADTVWPPRLTDRPLTNRYHPWGDTRALDYLEANPTYDGRGVSIAMIDMNPDMLLPELQTARALDGSVIPKIAHFGTAIDAREEPDGRWLAMDDAVQATGGSLTWRDSTFRAPRDGAFRMAYFDESGDDQSQGAAVEKDVNRDGNPEGSSRLFAVLWDEDAGEVWVDTDQDRDFTDETALGDFSDRPVFGVFGTDDPDTPVRESVGFGVQIDAERRLVALNLGVASHASLVVGAAVGSRGENGRFDGMAPGAQLINISEGGAAYGQTESTILSAQAGADVIYFEQSSYITRTYLPRDGRLVPSVIGERLVERYGTSILSPTHNYPIVGAIDDIVMGRGVIGVNGQRKQGELLPEPRRAGGARRQPAHHRWLRPHGQRRPQARHHLAVELREHGPGLRGRPGASGAVRASAGLHDRRRHLHGHAHRGRRGGAADQRSAPGGHRPRPLLPEVGGDAGGAMGAPHRGVQAGQRRDQRGRRLADPAGPRPGRAPRGHRGPGAGAPSVQPSPSHPPRGRGPLRAQRMGAR